MTSISPFGQTGPYKDYKAYPLNTYHSSGGGYLLPGGLQYASRPPVKAGGFFGECAIGLITAPAILAALYGRSAIGSGQYIEISKQQALMALERVELVRYANEGLLATRTTRAYRYGGVMKCMDGYMEIPFHEERQWQGLMAALGNPAWAEHERFRTHQGRCEHGEEVQALLAEELLKHSREHIYHRAQANHCPASPYYTSEDLLNSQQLREREFFVEIAHREAGKLKYPSVPYQFSETPAKAWRPAPTLGEHNEEVYCGRLGYSKLDLVQMRQAGII